MSTKGDYTQTGSNAGQKAAGSEGCARSSVYSKCAECPVYAYRDALCNDNLYALAKSGNPTAEELEEARNALTTEFAELTGNMSMKAANMKATRIMALRCRIMALSVAALSAGDEHAAALFKTYGWGKLPKEVQIKRAEAKIKEFTVQMNKAAAQSTKRKERAPQHITEAEFNMQGAIVSRWLGFHLSDRMMLAEWAGYFKMYSEQIKIEQNARNNKKY